MKLPAGMDLNNLKLIGQGIHGRVYRIDQDTCIKIYHKPEYLTQELANLQKVQQEPCFPKVIKWKKHYMIREFVPGRQLDKYLRKHRLNRSIARQLLHIFHTFKRHHFNCLDICPKNLLIDNSGAIRVIDLVHVTEVKRPYPMLLLGQLKQLGLHDTFLAYVKNLDPPLYSRWKRYEKLNRTSTTARP